MSVFLVWFPQQSMKSNLYPVTMFKSFARPSANQFKKLSLKASDFVENIGAQNVLGRDLNDHSVLAMGRATFH